MMQLYLWTDGRYFVQAEKELKNSEVELYKMGLSDTPSIVEFLKENISEYGKIAFDGNCG